MSYKDEIETIKNDIIGEGRFLEYFVHLEKFYKKYKYVVWGTVVALIAVFVYSKIAAYQDEVRVTEATAAYNKLLKNPEDSGAKDALKAKSAELYDMYMLSQASKTEDKKVLQELSSKGGLLGNIASYQLASINKDLAKLQKVKASEGAILKDLATLETALLKYEVKDYAGFKAELEKISVTSNMKKSADVIAHLGIEN